MREGSLLIFELKKFCVIFFACIFKKYLKQEKMTILKHSSQNEMVIYCFSCRDFIQSFFIILSLY